ncbi:MAG: hypothetical protein ABFS08_08780 [Pseudomonadota bacterium]
MKKTQEFRMKKLAIVILSLQGAGVACATPPAVTHSEATKEARVAQSTAKQNVMKAESRAAESPGPDGITQTVTNTSFAFTSVHNPQKQDMTESVLLAQKIESVSVVGKEGAETKLEVAAWVDGKSHYDTKMWTIHDCADAGWRDGDFYITSKYGQGGAENLMRAFNFSSGKYVYTYTTEPASAEIYVPKDMIKRHVAYTSRRGTDSACRKSEMGKNAVGVLVLTDGVSQADRIAVESGNAELARSPAVVLVDKKETKGAADLMVWGPAEFASDREVVRGFAVKLTYPGGSHITIPVSGDRFDLDRASTPRGVKLRRVKVEKGTAK